jgi:hypothetical protein
MHADSRELMRLHNKYHDKDRQNNNKIGML